MNKFIAFSPSSKQALQIAQMSASLPVNIIIFGESQSGKKLLAQEILSQTDSFNALKLEKFIQNNKINLKQYNTLIIYDLDRAINRQALLDKLSKIKIVATSRPNINYGKYFAVKIELPPLKQRQEDLKEITKFYTNEAINGTELKRSICKKMILKSLDNQDIENILANFFKKQFKENRNYKELIDMIELPLLKVAKEKYTSQLQISEKLNINRMTLRKKMAKYGI